MTSAVSDNVFKAFGKKISKQLNAADVKNFDPLRFAYIQSLSQRLGNSQHGSNTALIEKARHSAQQYTADLAAKRQQASKVIARISADFPQHTEVAQGLFEQCKFRQLEQLSARLRQQSTSAESINGLRELTEELSQRASGSNDNESPLTLNELLSQQEEDARSATGEASAVEPDASEELPELQSMKAHRESMKHFNIDKVIARAISDGPENPGPHNPQMLAIDALTQMRDLSPQYLRRFAGYIETLLWLENPGVKLSTKKRK